MQHKTPKCDIVTIISKRCSGKTTKAISLTLKSASHFPSCIPDVRILISEQLHINEYEDTFPHAIVYRDISQLEQMEPRYFHISPVTKIDNKSFLDMLLILDIVSRGGENACVYKR